MSKYYYVRIANDSEKEIHEAVNLITTTVRLVGNDKAVTAIKGIKKAMISDGKKEYASTIPFPIICDMKTTSDDRINFVDVITGKTYWRKTDENCKNPSIRPILEPVSAIETNTLKKLIASLSEEEIAKYKRGIDILNNNMRVGYKNYLKRVEQDDDYTKKHSKKR